jgi:hypothetical protein
LAESARRSATRRHAAQKVGTDPTDPSSEVPLVQSLSPGSRTSGSLHLFASTLAALAVGLPANAEVTILREPVYALDARSIVGANRVMARTRFFRSGVPSCPPVGARAALARPPSRSRADYGRFLRERLARFLAVAHSLGLRTDDAGDARAYFIQIAFKVYDGRAFGEPATGALQGPGLWSEGAIAGMARSSAWLARFAFVTRLKFVMGSNRSFASLPAKGKQRIYDYYALAAQLLIDGCEAAVRTGDAHELGLVRRTAREQLRLDLGIDPDRVHFTPSGIDVE